MPGTVPTCTIAAFHKEIVRQSNIAVTFFLISLLFELCFLMGSNNVVPDL